jgi:hypothetical protein
VAEEMDSVPPDILVLLEIVRYLNIRVEHAPASTDDVQLFGELLRMVPSHIHIGSIIQSQVNKSRENVMGDHYEVTGQVGAVGPKAVAIGQHFTQIWDKSSAEIDLSQLANELHLVRQAARSASDGDPADDMALGELASAEIAAKEGDGPKALLYLARAGKWALEVAKSIGVPVAVKAIESAIAP